LRRWSLGGRIINTRLRTRNGGNRNEREMRRGAKKKTGGGEKRMELSPLTEARRVRLDTRQEWGKSKKGF